MSSKPKPSSSKGGKRKHVTLTLSQKLEIIKRLEEGEGRNVLMKKFNIGSSTIYDIKKQKDKLIKFASQLVTTEKLASRQTLKKPKLEQLDCVLFEWFSAVRSEGKPVTGPMIVEQAKKFGQILGVPENECNYSDGWLRNFKFRHGILKLDVTGETLLANRNSAEKLKEEFEKIKADNDTTSEEIYNANETGLLWQCLPTSTLAGVEEKAAKGFKKSDSDVETEEKEEISWAEAAEALNKFISFAEDCTSYSASEIIDLHIIRNKFYTKSQRTKKRKDIRDFFKPK